MSDLLNIGSSGLNAAELALGVVGNNIANANTPGYDREVVNQAESISDTQSGLSIGTGTTVESVSRQVSSFMTTAVWNSTSSLQAATVTNSYATALNQVLSGSGNIQTELDGFYQSFSTIANTPGTSSSLESSLASADSLSAEFNTFGQQVSQQLDDVNSQVASTVSDINTQA